jgi:hypothetical protein
MGNESLEFIRILAYVFGISGLITIGVILKKIQILTNTIALYFAMWAILLMVQITNPDQYREISNLVSTPSLVIMVLSIFLNLWIIRKE